MVFNYSSQAMNELLAGMRYRVIYFSGSRLNANPERLKLLVVQADPQTLHYHSIQARTQA
jgi:hypothetical protein